MTRPLWFVLALAALGPTAAADEPPVDEASDTAEPKAAPTGSATSLRKVLRDPDGIWAWLARLDGESPPAEALAAIEERVERELLERAFQDDLLGLDVPRDFYEDPRRVLTGDPLLLDLLDPSEFDIPIVVNEHVERWMTLLLGPYRRHFSKWLERKARYEPMIHAELDAAGLPRDLIWLSMIESGFNAHAYSHAHAAGLWQFIPSTGRMYGLAVDFWLDERRDPHQSTRAAARMLGELNRQFGDWYLAFAAYNTGPARIRRNLDRITGDAPRDYWSLLDQDLLHRETQGYVPKMIAAAIIGKHPERYGFTDLELHEPLASEAVRVDRSVDVEVLARCAGLDEEAFRALNPSLRRFAVPEGGVDLRVPPGTAQTFLAALAEVPEDELRRVVLHSVSRGESLSVIADRYGVRTTDVVAANRLANPNRLAVGQKLVIPVAGDRPTEAVLEVRRNEPPAAREASGPSERPATYTVARGDALSVVASRFGLAQDDLVRWNGLSDASSLRVGQVLRLSAPEASDVEPEDGEAAVAEAPSDQAPAVDASAPTTVEVRAGDTLSGIAARHDVPLAQLLAWNDLTASSMIRVGQTLRLTEPEAASGAETPDEGPTTSSYTVRPGDALSVIAQRHGVSLRALQAANGISDPSALRVGQVLTIPASSAGWTEHTVRSGESLGIIASRYGVSVSDLKAWNDLDSSTIYPGDTLRIRSDAR